MLKTSSTQIMSRIIFNNEKRWMDTFYKQDRYHVSRRPYVTLLNLW